MREFVDKIYEATLEVEDLSESLLRIDGAREYELEVTEDSFELLQLKLENK